MQRILIAVCGGIAAYKSAELVRVFKKNHFDVRVVMTHEATKFINPLTFQALTGNVVYSDLWMSEENNGMGHIELARWADCLIVAPATANCLAKLAYGLADDLVSTIYLATNCSVFIAPAMNQGMWHKPATQRNIEILKRDGTILIEPQSGEQACGDIGIGRLAEPLAIFDAVIKTQHLFLKNIKILITAGATLEPLDPVRYLTNRSSGKMGYAIAQRAIKAGANVTLISGKTQLKIPEFCQFIQIETAQQMYEVVLEHVEKNDIYIGSAAVADYKPVTIAENKIKKNSEQLTIVLEKNPDILTNVARLKSKPFTVGFAAETCDLEKNALDKLNRKNVDMIAANWVGQGDRGFDNENNALEVFWRNGRKSLPLMTKTQLAEKLLMLISEKFHEKNA